jgi:hypothetical protein
MQPLAEAYKYQHAVTLKFLMPSNLSNTEENQAELQEEAEACILTALEFEVMPKIEITKTELMEDAVKRFFDATDSGPTYHESDNDE